jgi:hypothetical protein
MASTLRCTRRSIPAMPMAESSAPMVVGMSETNSAMSTVWDRSVSAYRANGRSVTTAATKVIVSPASRMLRAISFGVLRRSAPSTRAIMRSRNDWPGSWVTSITSRSESSFVPPVTAERSPPASRITGADSPVMADSSTEPTPSMISPSAGMMSPASTTTMSPRSRSGAGTSLITPSEARRNAVVVCRVARRALAWALPRPSAMASAKFANSTVSHSQTAITPGNQALSPCARALIQISVVMAEPSSTMNITGFRNCERGSSLGNESRIAPSTISRENRPPVWRAISAHPDRGPG